MPKSNLTLAHESAVNANASYAQAVKAEDGQHQVDRKKKIITEKINMALAIFLLIIYAGIVVCDAIIMAPILKVFTVQSMTMSQSMVPFVIGFYILLAMGFAIFISKGLLRAINPQAKEVDIAFGELTSPEKAPATILREAGVKWRREFRLAMALFFIFIVGVVLLLALTRNYYSPSHQLVVKVKSPSDFSSIVLPLATAVLMFLLGMYKEVVLKWLAYSPRNWATKQKGCSARLNPMV
jgi:hypothetical protein